jgi:hypothetical protein
MKLFITVFRIVRYPLFEVESAVQLERVAVYDEYIQKMLVALFSRMQEFSIAEFPYMRINPSELREPIVFLRMLQLVISYNGPDLSKPMQIYPKALLSANDEYDNEHATELESTVGTHQIPEKYWHLLLDELTDGHNIFPL